VKLGGYGLGRYPCILDLLICRGGILPYIFLLIKINERGCDQVIITLECDLVAVFVDNI